MSTRSVSINTGLSSVNNYRLSNNSRVTVNKPIEDDSVPWIRPADWLELPEISGGPQRFVGLCRINPTGNFLAFSCGTNSGGAYSIDWGDGGAIENVNNAVTAYHEYDYNSISNSGEANLGYRQVLVSVVPSGATIT